MVTNDSYSEVFDGFTYSEKPRLSFKLDSVVELNSKKILFYESKVFEISIIDDKNETVLSTNQYFDITKGYIITLKNFEDILSSALDSLLMCLSQKLGFEVHKSSPLGSCIQNTARAFHAGYLESPYEY